MSTVNATAQPCALMDVNNNALRTGATAFKPVVDIAKKGYTMCQADLDGSYQLWEIHNSGNYTKNCLNIFGCTGAGSAGSGTVAIYEAWNEFDDTAGRLKLRDLMLSWWYLSTPQTTPRHRRHGKPC